MSFREFVPKGQTIEDWEEMLTSQIFYGGIGKSVRKFAGDMRESWKSSCPDSEFFPVKSGKENGYVFKFWLQSCEVNPKTNKPEFIFLKAIEGNDSFYVIQIALKRYPIEEEVVTWTHFLEGAFVCDSRIPERRCPDFTK